MNVELITVSRPIIGDGDPRRLVELAVKTSSGKVREKGTFGHHYYLKAERTDGELNKWLIEASEKFPSVLEHIVFTFYIDGISRVTSHQLVRHRIASYTQESQRYSVIAEPRMLRRFIDEVLGALFREPDKAVEKLREFFVFPKSYNELGDEFGDMKKVTYDLHLIRSLMRYVELIEAGIPPEDARFVLPLATKTRLIMTVNLRELLHIGCMRIRDEAQAEIRAVVEVMFMEVLRKTGIPIWEMWRKYCKAGDK